MNSVDLLHVTYTEGTTLNSIREGGVLSRAGTTPFLDFMDGGDGLYCWDNIRNATDRVKYLKKNGKEYINIIRFKLTLDGLNVIHHRRFTTGQVMFMMISCRMGRDVFIGRDVIVLPLIDKDFYKFIDRARYLYIDEYLTMDEKFTYAEELYNEFVKSKINQIVLKSSKALNNTLEVNYSEAT